MTRGMWSDIFVPPVVVSDTQSRRLLIRWNSSGDLHAPIAAQFLRFWLIWRAVREVFRYVHAGSRWGIGCDLDRG